MTAPTCQNCKHWTLLEDYEEMPEWGECAMTVCKGRSPKQTSTIAYAQDGDGYYARLISHSTFSCNQHQPRET
jgi:hypothetical protein